MPERVEEVADVFRTELVQGESVRNVPWIVPLLLGREGDVRIHFPASSRKQHSYIILHYYYYIIYTFVPYKLPA